MDSLESDFTEIGGEPATWSKSGQGLHSQTGCQWQTVAQALLALPQLGERFAKSISEV